MADFLDSVKNKVSAAVSRTSWEAQKQMRVRSKQTEVDKLLEQREKLLNDLAQSAIELYQKGALTDAQLSRLCASIQELDHDVQQRETQLLDIKKEPYPVQQLGPAPTTDYTPPTSSYVPPAQNVPQPPTPPYVAPAQKPPQSPAASYVPPAQKMPQPPPAAPASARAPQGQAQFVTCPTCGNSVRANALYCRNCGTKMR